MIWTDDLVENDLDVDNHDLLAIDNNYNTVSSNCQDFIKVIINKVKAFNKYIILPTNL